MTIKLTVLKSGEDIVSDMQEMLVKDSDGKDKTVGYFLRCPQVVKIYGNKVEEDGGNSSPFKIQLIPWMPLSKDQVIPVVADWIVTMVDPVDQVKEMYERGLEKYEKGKSEASGDGERPDDIESD